MVYIETRKGNGKKYYFLVKNIRTGKNKWKKERKYFGKKKPSEGDAVKFSSCVEPVTKTKYLKKEQLQALEKIKFGYKSYLGKLTAHDFRQFEDATLTSFTYNTNAIEGSTLSLQDTGIILHKGLTPSGKDLREIYGATNMWEAYNYMKKMKELTEESIKKLHFIVMKNILEYELGQYRSVPVRIIGSRVQPPFPIDLGKEMENLIDWYSKNKSMHPVELACLLRIKFEKIHPFRDGNGRVGRLIMNFVLLKNKYPLLDIKVDKKLDYYKTLEAAQVGKKYNGFIDYCFDIYMEDAEKMGWV